MSGYDPVSVYTATTSDAAPSSGITFRVLVHKAVVYNLTPATAGSSVLIYNAATATGTAKIAVASQAVAGASGSITFAVSYCDPPVPFDASGLSTTLAGSPGTTVQVYYTRD